MMVRKFKLQSEGIFSGMLSDTCENICTEHCLTYDAKPYSIGR